MFRVWARPGKQNLSSCLVLATGAVLSVAGFVSVGRVEMRDLSAQFRAIAADRVSMLRRELESRTAIVRTGRRMLRDEGAGSWQRLKPVAETHLGERKSGLWWIWLAGGVPAGQESRFPPISVGAPVEGWRPGANAVAELRRQFATAFANGREIASAAVADPAGKTVVALAVPLAMPGTASGRRAPVSGMLVEVFSLGAAVQEAAVYAQPVGLATEIHDSSDPRRGERQVSRVPGRHDAVSWLSYSASILLAGREWRVRMDAEPYFVSSRRGLRRWLLLGVFLLLTAATTGLLRKMLSINLRVRTLVARRTRALRALNRRLRDSELRLEKAQEAARLGVWDWNIARGETLATEELFAIYGKPRAGRWLNPQEWVACIAEEDRDRVAAEMEAALAGRKAYETEFRIMGPDGQSRWLLAKGQVYRDEQGNPVRMLGVNVDITALKTAQEALRESEDRFHRAFANAPLAMAVLDREGNVVEVNEAACQASGYSREEMLARNFRDLAEPATVPALQTELHDLICGSRGDHRLEAQVVRKDGAVISLRISVALLRERGASIGILLLCEDITAVKEAERQLAHQTFHDPLTGLPNRLRFSEALVEAAGAAERNREELALLYFEIEDLTLVNDTLGTAIGDRILEEAASRARSAVLANDVLARVGGATFALGAAHVGAAEAESMARGLLAVLGAPYAAGSGSLTLSTNIGIAMFPADTNDSVQLIRQASVAMVAARRDGKNTIRRFVPEMLRAARERLEAQNDLRTAIERGEFMVYYQPEFELDTHRLVRFEALARWKHPVRGFIPPVQFIPIAEETGLIAALDQWVMRQACTRARKWQQMTSRDVQVAVNVSTLHFFRPGFVESVAEILEMTGLPPGLLQIELTESVAVPGLVESAAIVNRLQALGVTISIDDFGTGYSALSYLPHLAFDALKIDRSFVKGLPQDGAAKAVVRSLATLAHNLNMRVIVEGVEEPDQLHVVRELGCDEVQGYLLGRPGPDPERYLAQAEAADNLWTLAEKVRGAELDGSGSLAGTPLPVAVPRLPEAPNGPAGNEEFVGSYQPAACEAPTASYAAN